MNLKHISDKKISEGSCYPLGATCNSQGINFAIYSKYAEQVFLLLFDSPDSPITDIIEMPKRTKYIWHVHVSGLKPGQLYGYKVKGKYIPEQGLRFNENKLLLDPYAKAITSKFINKHDILFGFQNKENKFCDILFDTRDNSTLVPKSIVIDDTFDWSNDVAPNIPIERLIIYEAHLKGFTAHRSSGVKNPGTYLGFIEKIPYLKEIGINAIEFLPIQEFYNEDFTVNKELKNYWGYNTIGFFAPESSYSTGSYIGCQVNEFKTLVKELHKAGIEVIIDVVYNHTGEGNEKGPTICFKGIDNPTYYCLYGDNNEPKRFYENYSGCGNSINITDPIVIRLVMDSLRYWVEKMHVDGFRFDLASILGLKGGHYQKTTSFFDAISQDPILNRVKLIAEPWHIGDYQIGNFPVDWCEWNSKFRNTVRKFWKSFPEQIQDLGWRLTGSADLYKNDGRSPYNSINFITCHDGFTLYDLLSYNNKHNDANQENNQDGTNENNSWNCGVEGDTDDLEVIALRRKLAKNHLLTLLFSSGTPMVLAGDEFLRTQKGNNNAYCQDNSISWINWDLLKTNNDIFEFFKKLVSFSKKYPILQRGKFFEGIDTDGNQIPDIEWYDIDGLPFIWNSYGNRTICYQLDGREEVAEVRDYMLYIILNADYHDKVAFIPRPKNFKTWYRVIDTGLTSKDDFLENGQEIILPPNNEYLVKSRSAVVFIAK
jgi:glycogen operon protein